MASPDVTPYLDLTLDDRDPQDLLDLALNDAAVKLPGWIPREGNTEVVLLEAMALPASELVFAINRVPGSIMEVLLKLYGVDRDLGGPATATARLTAANAAGYTIPAGTRLAVDLGTEQLAFTTDVDLVIPPASTTGTVAITAEANGSEPNGIPSGRRLVIVDALVQVNDAVLTTAIGGGRDEELSADYFTRAGARLQRLNTALVLAEQFRLAAIENPAVFRAFAIDRYDPTSGHEPGEDLGHVTIALASAGGGTVAGGTKTAIAADLASRAMAGLTVHVVDATVTPVNVTSTVRAFKYQDLTAVHDAVVDALTAYLDPDTWSGSATVPHNELIAVIDRAAGVDLVVSVTVPAGDLALPGVAPLAAPGTFTITVNAAP